MEEEMKALPESTDSPLDQFSALFERSSKLRDVLDRLPGKLVLKSGMAANRNGLIDSWDKLESPGLDGSLPDGALEGIGKWIHKAEVCITYVVQIGRKEQRESFGRSFSSTNYEPEFEVVSSIAEVDFVSNEWCWPWSSRALAREKKPKMSKDKMLKYGVLGALGLVAVATYMDEDA